MDSAGMWRCLLDQKEGMRAVVPGGKSKMGKTMY